MFTDWTDRVWREHRAGTLTRSYRDVLLTLRSYRGHGGLICPAHETLAERAKCSVSTVQRALHQAQRLGLVGWAERRVRAGWRWFRASNRYWLTVPDGPVEPSMRPVWWRRATTSQDDGGGESESIERKTAQKGRKAALVAMVREAQGMPDLLALRRAVIEGRFAACLS